MTDIGRISDREFFELRGNCRRWGLSAILGCVISLGAGFGGGYAEGKHTQAMTFEEAIAILNGKSEAEWKDHAALGATWRTMLTGTDALSRWAAQPGAGVDAALYLRHEARACIRAIRALAEDPNSPHLSRHLDSLRLLREELQ